MQSGDFTNHPNPFALHVDGNRPSRSSFRTAAKFFAMITLLFGVTLAVGSQSRQWIVNRLMSGFSELQVPEKQQRLAQISELGIPAIEPLVDAILDPETEVARTACELLRQSQNHWTSFDWSDSRTYHEELVKQLARISSAIPEGRTGWTTSLIQQTIMESVQKDDAASKNLYNFASQTLGSMSLSTGSGPSVLDTQPLDQNAPVRLMVRSKPLPVADAESFGAWTDWPTPQSRETSSHIPSDEQPSQESKPGASVYRSSASKLRPVESGENIVLRDIQATKPDSLAAETVPVSASPLAVTQSPPAANGTIVPTSYLTDSAFESYDDQSVIHWLGSEEASLRQKAKLELMRRGFSAQQIEIATQIASPDSASRLALVDAIARSRIENPRPWLAILLNDSYREVRLKTISVIATMNDPEMMQTLRSRLEQERDPIVNARIRRVLKLR
ncbi:hypothetical protein Q31b_46070 [Novipirellula aureliae]|uniref:HEAT repeat protein n=1 Tax=Novipirellula aureliae TaxID=2527966 RepID=A0A5C6DLZ5_9BACT|nr:HEAT repeat domain-containing protein [Novipirellula aureliae]TWU37818.1 hypothetical protein Q31b_46070 [Novipirellula aureliae]